MWRLQLPCVITRSVEEFSCRLTSWKVNLENKGLIVNIKKAKVMFSGQNMNRLLDSGMWPFDVCWSGAGSNCIFCSGCKHWVHKNCTRICGRLVGNASLRSARCCSLAQLTDGCPCNSMALGMQILEIVDSFCYLGDTINASGGCTQWCNCQSQVCLWKV